MTRTIAGLMVMLAVMTACGGSSDTGGDSPEAEPDAVATTSASETAEVVAMDIAPCDLLTADEVAAATGLAVEEVRDEPPIDCVYDLGADAGVDVYVTIEDGQGRLAAPANLLEEYLLLVADGEAEVVTGVGEQAVCCPFRAIAVDAGGGRFIAVSVGGLYTELAEPRDVLISLAETALGRL
jgi:hypothetical protein